MKPTLLIPMAGKGQRFIDGGFTTPKQLIDVGGQSLIEWSLKCVLKEGCNVVFVVRRDMVDNHNIIDILKEKFGNDISTVIAETETEGTVCSCLLAEQYIDNEEPLAIWTLDTFFRPYFDPHSIPINSDGMILTFKATNPTYSYSVIDKHGFVIQTAEKQLISNNASLGLFCFTKGSTFVKYAHKMIRENVRFKNEFYVCPMYNLLINDGLKIVTREVTEIYHMGTPHELVSFLTNDLQHLKEI